LDRRRQNIAGALAALTTQHLAHDDLNMGNIIAAQPPEGSLSDELEFRIIDLGSLKRAESHEPRRKEGIDDFRWVALHLTALFNASKRRRTTTIRERRFHEELIEIIRALLEEDPYRRLRDPLQFLEQVEAAWTRSASLGKRNPTSPFEFISAEQIADDISLRTIFATSLPWLHRVHSTEPQVVTGPRGCGKSTLFRWLSLRAQLQAGPAADLDLEFAGIYISCRIDVQNRIGWITDDEIADGRRAEVLHFFNILLLRELVGTLAFAQGHRREDLALEITRADEDAIVEILSDALGGWEPSFYQGVSKLEQLSEDLREELRMSHLRTRYGGNAPRPLTTEATIADVTSRLASRFPFFREHTIVFLIDDFSFHRVPRVVQELLHPVIWQPTSSHRFKVSAEKHGTQVGLPSGATAEIAREMTEVDLGEFALERVNDEGLQFFATELLTARLRACGYVGTVESLLGHSDYGKDESGRPLTLAEHIYHTRGTRGSRKPVYHGIECISQLCTGDIAAVLLVMQRIFHKAGVTKDTTSQISKSIQHQAIRSVSTDLVEQTRAYQHVGPRMYSFLNEFGRFVADALRGMPPQTKGLKAAPQPVQIPRIEIDSVSDTLSLLDANDELREVYDELLRRAILIQCPMTRGIHGDTVLGLHLRRVFLPSFSAALGKNVALIVKPAEFLALLANPAIQFEVFRRRKFSSQEPLDFDGVGDR